MTNMSIKTLRNATRHHIVLVQKLFSHFRIS